MENELNSLFKKPVDTSIDSLFKKPKNSEIDAMFSKPKTELDTMFTKPETEQNNPRNGLSKPQVAEAEGNKDFWKGVDDTVAKAQSYIPSSIAPTLKIKPSSYVAGFKGFTHNMDEYGASINKGLGKLSKAILPKEYQTTFFDDNAKYWNDKRKQNEIETEDNKYAHLAGEMILDPINITPTGVISKGTKLARIGKSMGVGAGVGYATSKAKNYGNDNLTDAQKSQEDAMSTGIVSVLNGVIAGLTKGKVTNAIKDVEHLTTSAREEADSAIDTLISNPEAFGLSKANATKLSEEYQALLKAHTGRSSRLPQDYGKGAKDSVEATQNWRPVPQHEVVKYNPIIDSVLNRKPEITTPKSYRQTDGSFDWEAFGNEHPEGKIFDAHGNELDMPTPQPELIREKSNAGFNEPDNIDGLDFTSEEIAKVQDGLKNRSDLSSDADTFISNISTTLSKSKNPIALELKNIIETDPLAQRALDSARERYAKQTYNETAGGSAGSWIDPETGLVKRAGNKGSKNADFEFALTKSDINKILKGDVSDDILLKLKQDMSRYEHDPMFNTEVPAKGKFSQTQYDVAHDSLSTVEKQVRGEQGSLGFEGTQNPLFVPEAETQLAVPKWAKGLVSDTTRYEDIVKAVTDAKNGIHSDLADRAVQAMSEDADIAGKLYPEVNPNTLFSNAGHNLAGGFGAGTVNAGSGLFDGSYDPNKDLSEQMADKFIQGMVAGTLGVSGLRALRKANPKAFEKVRSWVMDNDIKVGDKMPTDGVQLGVFAGKKAKGFEGRTTHAGKYDGQERFEIDDSVAKVNPNAVVELSQKGHTTLGKLMKHDELFSNYPQLENVVVKFDKNMDAHATFDGENVITLSNKFKNKDEMASSILHEVQHWVQNKEGFAGGGNFDDMLRQVDGKIYVLEKRGELSELDAMNYRNDLDYLKNNRSAEAYNNYKKIAGEIEAREVQARHGLNAEERGLIEPYNNSETLGAGEHSDEAYNSAFMAELDGKLKDFDTTGIDPKDATLDFSRNKMDAMSQPSQNKKSGILDNNFDDLERLAKESATKDWKDISQDNGKVGNILNSIKHGMMDTMSGAYHATRDLTHAKLEKSNTEIARLAKVLDEFDDVSDKELYQYLTQTGGQNISPKVKQVGDMIRQTIDSIGNELVTRGLLDEKGYKEWVGAYLHRQYKPHLDRQGLRGFGQNFKLDRLHERGDSKTFKPTDIKGITGWLNKNGFISDAELMNLKTLDDVKQYLNDAGHIGMLKDGKLSISDTGGKVKLRRDWTKAEREAMGEIESAKVTVPETLARLNRLKQHGEFLKRVETVDGAVLDKHIVQGLSDSEIGQAGYTKLNGVQYGALNGKYVRHDVADDIGRTYKDIANMHGDAFRAWNGYNSLWKKSKTVWNPTAHLNNFVGNLFLMHMAGVNGSKLGGVLNEGRKAISALSRIEDLQYKALKNSLTQSEKTELSQLSNTAKYALEAKEIGIFGKSQLNDILSGVNDKAVKTGMLHKLDDVASKWYQGEDNFNRLSFYLTLRHSGKDSKLAKQMVDYMLPDYSKPLPKGWRFLRDSNVAPFISWSYYTMPSIVKMLGTKRGMGKVATVMASLSAMEYALTGGEVTPLDNIPFVDGKKPEDFKGRRFAVGKDGDEIDTVKMDRMIPYVELKDPVNYVKSQFSGVIPNLFSTINGNQMYNGRPITYKNKSGGDKAIDWLKHLTKQYGTLPMPVVNALDLADSAVRSKKKRKRNNTILPRSPAQEVLKNIGINTMSYSKRGLKRDQNKK